MDEIGPKLHEVTLNVDNRSLELIPAMTKNEARIKIESERNRKLYVGGLPPDITKNDLKEYFETFGKLEYANVVYSIGSTLPRGFAFIKYVDEASAQKTLDYKRHHLKGSVLFIKKSKTRQEISSKLKAKTPPEKILESEQIIPEQISKDADISENKCQIQNFENCVSHDEYYGVQDRYYHEATPFVGTDFEPSHQTTLGGKTDELGSEKIQTNYLNNSQNMLYQPNTNSNFNISPCNPQNMVWPQAPQYYYVEEPPKINYEQRFGTQPHLNQIKQGNQNFQTYVAPKSTQYFYPQQYAGAYEGYAYPTGTQLGPQSPQPMVSSLNNLVPPSSENRPQYVQVQPQGVPSNQIPGSTTSIDPRNFPQRTETPIFGQADQDRVLPHPQNNPFYSQGHLVNYQYQQPYDYSNNSNSYIPSKNDSFGFTPTKTQVPEPHYYYYYPQDTGQTIPSNSGIDKSDYTKFRNSTTQPSNGEPQEYYPQQSWYPVYETHKIDQLFCDGFSELTLKDNELSKSSGQVQNNGEQNQYSHNNLIDYNKYQAPGVNADSSGRLDNVANQSSGRNLGDSGSYYDSGVDSNYDGRTPYSTYPGFDNQSGKNLRNVSTTVVGSGNTIGNLFFLIKKRPTISRGCEQPIR